MLPIYERTIKVSKGKEGHKIDFNQFCDISYNITMSDTAETVVPIMPKQQREVSENLGKNNTSCHEQFYAHIEKKYGPFKDCSFGHTRGSKTGVKHEGEQKLPIREFELKGCSIDHNNEVIIKKGDGLQGFCRTCSRRRRRIRSKKAQEKNEGHGYDIYERDYGKSTKKCSKCKEEKHIKDSFKLSPSMECGIHNVCIICTQTYGDSAKNRIIIYRPDGNHKYEKTEEGQHDDHIMPLASGGTNEEANHRLIPAKENLSKSSTIPFSNVNDIPATLMCERWRPILAKAKTENISITDFKSRMACAILDEQRDLYSKTDEEIEYVFKLYNTTNNRRINTKRAVKKFKQYCKEILNL